MHKSTCLAAAAACALLAAPAFAQSSGDWDIGTIYATANNFCPVNTLEAQGQTQAIPDLGQLASYRKATPEEVTSQLALVEPMITNQALASFVGKTQQVIATPDGWRWVVKTLNVLIGEGS